MGDLPGSAVAGSASPNASTPRRRIAALVHEYWAGSHADLIVTKLMAGYEMMWVPMAPRNVVHTLYVHDPGPTDVGYQRARLYGVRTAPTVQHTLCDADGRLAVSGVVIVGERNEKSGRPVPVDARGRPVDSRFYLFNQTAALCEQTGLAVPVFVDKYLATSWSQIKEMYQTAQRLGMPLMAGSSVPVTLRPPAQVPHGARVDEVVVVASGIGEAPLFHALEWVESMIERRAGGETGVAAVELLSGSALWDAWIRSDRWSAELAEAALAEVPHGTGSPKDFFDRRRRPVGGQPVSAPAAEEALIVHYVDGLRVSILLLTGYILRRALAIRIRGQDRCLSAWTPTGVKQTFEPMGSVGISERGAPKPSTWNFDHLAFFVDEFLRTGVAPIPVERTVLTSGILDAAVTSRIQGGVRVSTPELALEYPPPRVPIRR